MATRWMFTSPARGDATTHMLQATPLHRAEFAPAPPRDGRARYRLRRFPDGNSLVVGMTGDHAWLKDGDADLLETAPGDLSFETQAELQAKFILPPRLGGPGQERLLRARHAARHETTLGEPSLHIIVPTLQCAHTCRYCQVSRALSSDGHSMTLEMLDAACDSVFDSRAPSLTVEFQGGDPLLRFDLVRRAIQRITRRNDKERRRLRIVIASTLHQLDREMCAFLKEHGVFLSTSIDGPAQLHDKNRPLPTRDSHERTIRGLELARSTLGSDSVSALMTTTRESLREPEAIVDEYVRLGLRDIFLRPLSTYGFAKRNQAALGYSLEDFLAFHAQGLDRVIHWNRAGVPLREVYSSIIFNKILSPFDAGYVDLQSPTGAGSSVLVYNYDGYVYPSDEARMLVETGDPSLRMGRIGDSLSTLLSSPVRQALVEASRVERFASCATCAYSDYCAPNPVDAQAQFGRLEQEPSTTEHCRRHMALFDSLFTRLKRADDFQLDLFHAWAMPQATEDRP